MDSKKRLLKVVCLFVFFQYMYTLNSFAQQQDYYPDADTSVQRKLEEWKDLKFGLLMHWGPYSQWGVVESWSICPEDVGWATGARIQKRPTDNYNTYVKDYENLKTTFNPVKFNPEKWAAAARDAGMKYVVFTTKHHDGFCMFDTKTTEYKITGKDCPFSTDSRSNVTKEIFNAFRSQQLWVGAYFSKPDWHSNDYWWNRFPPLDRNANYDIKKHPETWQKFVDFTHKQIDELMTGYGKIDILWLDGGWVRKKTEEQAKKDFIRYYDESHFSINGQNQDINMPLLAKNARAKQPGLIVVDRDVPGEQQNYLTPEQHIPDNGLPYPWETCMTMASSWSYSPNDKYKSTEDLIKKLIDIVSKGGNYLLNIGPGPDGEWHDNAYLRLKEMGAWMKQNGTAIYGTRMYKVFGEGDNVRYTQTKDGKTKYVFLFGFPDKTIVLNKLELTKDSNLQLIGTNQKLLWKKTDAGIEISVPQHLRSSSSYVWVLKVQG